MTRKRLFLTVGAMGAAAVTVVLNALLRTENPGAAFIYLVLMGLAGVSLGGWVTVLLEDDPRAQNQTLALVAAWLVASAAVVGYAGALSLVICPFVWLLPASLFALLLRRRTWWTHAVWLAGSAFGLYAVLVTMWPR